MYAHQVIEGLKKNRQNIRGTETIIKAVKSAQHFYAGQYTRIDDLIRRDGDDAIFSGKMTKYAKFPFPSMLIFFASPSGEKLCILSDYNKDKIYALMFFSHHNGEWLMFPAGYTVTVNGTGKNIGVERAIEKEFGLYTEKEHGEYCRQYMSILEKFLILLNCKNITTEIIKAPEALNKKRRKNGKQEIFDYHVLNVVVPSNKQGYREHTEVLSHVRIHLCRGHFKEYTKEHPLFGRLAGLYWWQPHVRGQNKDGIVIKDYNIKTQ